MMRRAVLNRRAAGSAAAEFGTSVVRPRWLDGQRGRLEPSAAVQACVTSGTFRVSGFVFRAACPGAVLTALC